MKKGWRQTAFCRSGNKNLPLRHPNGRGALLRLVPAILAILAAIILPSPAVCGDNPPAVTESSRTYKDPACNFMVKDLENEIAETTASLKNCQPAGQTGGTQSSLSPKAAAARAKECEQYERKLKLTKENLLHVKEQCDKGLAPDYLPKVIENPGAVPCDNCAANKLLPKDPAAKVLTGLPGTGNVMDLKGGDPNLRTVFGKSAAAPAPAATGVPPPEFIGAWCCNNQFVEAADITAFYAKCCGICGEYCGTTPPIEPSCSASQDVVNGNCVPKCTGGQTRNAAGTCECPAGQVFSAGKCGCPSGQTLTAEGKCVASGGGDGGAVQPPATGQPPAKKPGFWAKVGDFFKAVIKALLAPLKWIADKLNDLLHSVFKNETEKCNGNYYNPETECCKAGEKRTDKISNIAACPPPRYKKTTPNTGDYGCFKNGITRDALLGIGYVLGSGKTIDNPAGGAYTSFFGACYQHDGNYDACNKGPQTDKTYKDAADQAFLGRMETVCDGDEVTVAERASCDYAAQIYYMAVSEKGDSFYQGAQLENCKCCPLGALP